MRQEIATRKVKWTSKADNGRKFRGKPREREPSELSRQLKKPRQKAGEDKVLQTDALGGEATGDQTRDFWYIESSSTDMLAPSVVMDAAVVEIETIDSNDSEDDNIPIAQTRKKVQRQTEF